MSTIKKLKEEIKKLKADVQRHKQNTYIHETNHLQVYDGEVHIGFGSYPDDARWLVWNVESLFKDLPFLISQTVKENKKMQQMYLDSIIETGNEIKKEL
tara:strand:+ start:6942 stop:7238 length:297 start_codon:yes stop_codon:yes gene_type:complete